MIDPSTRQPPISDRSGVTDGVRVQILSTEHWGLLATRSMLWNETFSRAGMFITLLSASLVAIALVAQATGFGTPFRLFALLVLPVVILMGFVSFVRLSDVNMDDIGLLMAMNRLRNGYLELAPELKPYFTTGSHDDLLGMFQSFGLSASAAMPPEIRAQLANGQEKQAAAFMESSEFKNPVSVPRFLSTTPALVGTINAVVVGAFAALFLDTLGISNVVGIVVGVIATLVVLALEIRYGFRQVALVRSTFRSRFPH